MNVERQDPIVVVELAAAEEVLTDVEAMERPIAVLDGAIRELDRFGLLVLAGGGDKAPRTPAQVRRRWRAWLTSREAEMKTKCVGVATVTTSAARATLLRLAAPAIRRMFHAPTAPFVEESAARKWLFEQLAKRSLDET